jgi:hypothetical protein
MPHDDFAEDALHIEAFLAEVFHITPEEHQQAKEWIASLRTGEMPPSLQRVAAGPLINQEFLELARKYEMRSTPFRKEILDKLYATAIGGLS